MAQCPACKTGELSGPVVPEGRFPRPMACTTCSYPLESDKLAARLAHEPITEVAHIAAFGDEYQLLSGADGLAYLERNANLAFPTLEDEKAVFFQVVNDLLIFNLGAPGAFLKYRKQSD